MAEDLEALFRYARDLSHPSRVIIKNPRADDDGRVPEEMEVAVDPSTGNVIATPDFLEKHARWPERVKDHTMVEDLPSFVELVNRHKLDRSVLFYSVGNGSQSPLLTAMLDYHAPSAGAEQGRAGNVQHMVTYTFPLSEQWKAWQGQDKKVMNQGDFAAWIEDRITDLLPVHDQAEWDPDSLEAEIAVKLGGATYGSPEQVLNLSKGLQVIVNEELKAAVNVQTGEMSWGHEEKHDHRDMAGERIRIPRLFLIGIPVFAYGATAWKIPVRLNYRKRGTEWHFAMYRAVQRIFEPAVETVAGEAAAQTGLPLFRRRHPGQS